MTQPWLRAMPIYHERGAKPVACEDAACPHVLADASTNVLLTGMEIPAGAWLAAESGDQ